MILKVVSVRVVWGRVFGEQERVFWGLMMLGSRVIRAGNVHGDEVILLGG